VEEAAVLKKVHAKHAHSPVDGFATTVPIFFLVVVGGRAVLLAFPFGLGFGLAAFFAALVFLAFFIPALVAEVALLAFPFFTFGVAFFLPAVVAAFFLAGAAFLATAFLGAAFLAAGMEDGRTAQ
jgi:hypothetical protein